MASYGQLRLRLSQMTPGFSPEMWDGWIQDVYTQILDQLPWKRQETESVIQSPLTYSAGSITVTQGSTVIAGSGSTWNSSMNGLMIRICNSSEYYQFQYVSPTSALLDRGYEQTTDPILTTTQAAGGAGYAVGDVFNVTGGNGAAQGTILQVDINGAVLEYQINTNGSNYAVASAVATVTSGLGVGFTLDITSITPSSNLAYRIDQAIYLLPSNCRIVRQVRPLHDIGWDGKPLERVTPAELNRLSSSRNSYGSPRYYCPTFDSFSDPPNQQIEFFPVPASPGYLGTTSSPQNGSQILSFAVTYDFDAASIDPTQTSLSLLPWVRPAAIIAGCRMKAAAGKDQGAYNMHKTEYEALVKTMLMNNAYQRGPSAVRLADQFKRQTRHSGGPGHGKWHRGYTG